MESNPRPITVSRPPRCPTPDACTATQAPPGTAAIPFGRLPTAITFLAPVGGSNLTTRWPNSALTQRVPSPNASADGPPETGIVARVANVDGSISETVLSSSLATHTAPAPYATPAGPFPTAAGLVTLFVAGSTCTSVFVDSSVTHTDPAPTAMPRPTAFVRMFLTTLPVFGLIRDTV